MALADDKQINKRGKVVQYENNVTYASGLDIVGIRNIQFS